MLSRLRPLRAVEFGLTSAVEDLAAFWRARRPDIAFELALRQSTTQPWVWACVRCSIA